MDIKTTKAGKKLLNSVLGDMDAVHRQRQKKAVMRWVNNVRDAERQLEYAKERLKETLEADLETYSVDFVTQDEVADALKVLVAP